MYKIIIEINFFLRSRQ